MKFSFANFHKPKTPTLFPLAIVTSFALSACLVEDTEAQSASTTATPNQTVIASASLTPTVTTSPSSTHSNSPSVSAIVTAVVTPTLSPTPEISLIPLLNDTGITLCGDHNHSQQDCRTYDNNQDALTGRDALQSQGLLEKKGGGFAGFDFTKLDIDGNELGAEAIGHSCVRDNVTGLIWQVKTTADEVLISLDEIQTYQDAINNLPQALCGLKQWQVPALNELDSLTHLGKAAPSIDTNFFPYTQPLPYWSSTHSKQQTLAAETLLIDFKDGSDVISEFEASYSLRLVHSINQ